ncbi:hypothetical protein PIB30_070928 [Stylosanthes scabra]|uniref:Uncharacterized protein n=1 Tax=Stylosanthes scabra TaxID=79078 RepID=A0ABU6QPB0_9FABA|nr:hypothetical protein [Stylosanthes scabra]
MRVDAGLEWGGLLLAHKRHVYGEVGFMSRRNRFEGCQIDSLDLNSLKSLNFEVIESIRSSSEPIRFLAGTQTSNLNRFVRGSNRLEQGIQKMEYLLRFLSRFGHKAN